MTKGSSYRFQISIDTDSIFISQAPNSQNSRIILANLKEKQLDQLAQSIKDANLTDKFIKALQDDD